MASGPPRLAPPGILLEMHTLHSHINPSEWKTAATCCARLLKTWIHAQLGEALGYITVASWDLNLANGQHSLHFPASIWEVLNKELVPGLAIWIIWLLRSFFCLWCYECDSDHRAGGSNWWSFRSLPPLKVPWWIEIPISEA